MEGFSYNKNSVLEKYDNIPTIDSERLVDSGAVKSYVDGQVNPISKTVYGTPTDSWVEQYSLSVTTSAKLLEVSYKAGDTIKISIPEPPLVTGMDFIVSFEYVGVGDHQKKFYETSITEATEYEYTFPEDIESIMYRSLNWNPDPVYIYFKQRTYTDGLVADVGYLKQSYVTPEMFGAKGDAETDDTTSIQSVFSSGKNICLSSGKTYIVDSINLVDTDDIVIFGNGVLKRKDNASNNSVLTINNCDNIVIHEINTDGNISNNGITVNQNQQSLTIKNSSNIHIGVLNDQNPSGDTLYLSNVSSIFIQSIVSVSDSFTGRNALSIISGENIYIDNIISINTGHNTMPGGIDLEPNSSSESIKNVTINNAYIISDGYYGFSISNAVHRAYISDITVNKCYVEKIEKSSNRSNGCVVLYVANNIHGNFVCKQTGTNVSQLDDGIKIGSISNSQIFIDTKNAARGVYVEGEIKNLVLKAIINDAYQNAIQINNTSSSLNNIFDISVGDFAKSGSGAGVMVTSGSTAYGIKITGDLSKKTYGGQCLRFEGTINDIVADNLDMSGWTASNKVYGNNAGSGNFIGKNCKNYNYLSSTPSGYDGYAKGTIIYNTNPSAGGYVGWVCTESGRPGTWKGFGTIQS